MRLRSYSGASGMKNISGRTLRVTLLISLAFLLKTVSSCINPVWDFDFSFNRITVDNLDNSGIYPVEVGRDTMYAAAVAFRVNLSDETILASCLRRNTNAAFTAFTPAAAEPPEPRYYPIHRITGISIVTLEAMSPEIPAGTEVTGLFVAHVPHFVNLDFLYLRADELPSVLDLDYYPGEPAVSFQLFCRENITSSTARFIITVTLSDESTLAATTGLITLVRNE